jgi:hypothetical protein
MGRLLTVVMLVCAAACAPSVSDHDNRIFATSASVKLSAIDLAAAYAADKGAAEDRYRGRVIEISGVVRGVGPTLVTLAADDAGQVVDASLHEDTAVELVKTVSAGQRVTLKCFCEGFDQRVRLKSCVAPDPLR